MASQYCTVIIIAQNPTAKAPVLLLKSGQSFKRQRSKSNTQMGSICSKSSHLTGGHTLVPSTDAQPRASAGRPSQRPQNAEARRSQAAEAAERRMQAESKRGVNAANPNSGRLAARLEASKTAPLEPEPRQEDAVIWD
ncbi:hypothetical protein EI94DRAFT_584846 [Lactarius quietus]|nr:hypothetical protein EI94DRAFT_584846 [Lactarius quietus]